MSNQSVRHILALSGGKDSSALAVYMKDKVPEMEYVFCDTGDELQETYDYLDKLEFYLGKKIKRIKVNNIDCDVDFSPIGYVISPNGTEYTLKVDYEGNLYTVDEKKIPASGQTPTTPGQTLAKLYINSLYCGGKDANEHTLNYCSHNFVELSNLTTSDINLKGLSLQYAIDGKVLIETPEKAGMINVALISHGYNIYDERASMKIFDKLEKLGVNVYTALQLTDEQMQEGLVATGSHRYWANSAEMTGAAGHYLKDNRIDGIITLNAFGCGPDSLMIESMIRKAKDIGKPLLSLTIDEHTGEAGFITRLEAFIDMLFRKKRSQIVNKIDIDDTYVPQTNVCENVLSK